MDDFKEYLENLKKTKKELKNTNYQLTLKNNKIIFTKKKLKELFLVYFEIMFKKEFNQKDDSNLYLELLLNYFCRNDEFLKSPLLNQNYNKADHDKGVLICGNYGVGKSKLLKTFEQMFKNEFIFNPNYHFTMYNATELKTTFEILDNNYLKNDFLKKHKTAFKCYDDVKSEVILSNYNKREIMKDIIHLRYESGARTIITCNFDENHPGDLSKALEEFGIMYDGRIYDRLFEMFNIVVINGQSKRN